MSKARASAKKKRAGSRETTKKRKTLAHGVKASERRGLVRVYVGNGEAKSTAALGLGMRAAGHGYRVFVLQVMKGGAVAGEMHASKKLPNFEMAHLGEPCQMHDEIASGSITCAECGRCRHRYRQDDVARGVMATAKAILSSGRYDLVILDELLRAQEHGLVELEGVLELVRSKDDGTELILTGNKAHPEIEARADIVTQVRDVKKGSVRSRLGPGY